MPTYDYVCEACGHAFEHFQGISSPRLRTCPTCKKRRLVRLVGAGAGLIFKGSGFYETDYKRAGEPPRPSEGSESTKDSNKESTSDAKQGTKEAAPSAGSGGKAEPGAGPKSEGDGKKASGNDSSSPPTASGGTRRAPKKGTS